MKITRSEPSWPSADIARIAIEYAADGLLVIDAEGFIRFANPAAKSLFSCQTDTLVGFQIGFPASTEPVELALPCKDGLRHVEMRAVEIDWEGRTASLASLREITDRKRAEDTLQVHAESLQRQNDDLTRFMLASVAREMNMIHLKEEVNELCTRLGLPIRYRIPSGEPAVREVPKP
jgi:nitrogen-specific signal transduction histidine kinase